MRVFFARCMPWVQPQTLRMDDRFVVSTRNLCCAPPPPFVFKQTTMSLTADGEFFKCDMCGVYFHMNIFCSHRRQCKGLDSQEMKKELIAEVQGGLDKDGRRCLAEMTALNPEFSGTVVSAKTAKTADVERANAPLDMQQARLVTKRNQKWQRELMEEEDRALEQKIAAADDDILAGFDDED